MRKLFTRAALLIAGMFTLSMSVSAQQMPLVPADDSVRIGKLDNGLTYYIRHNETPKGQADFYIAQKVGSALEEDNQRGLAHFLEHMCFNGTENFPGSGLVDWLESIGVKFGQNLNAYTGVDETVYNISNVPVARKGVQDSCLLILHDWADGLLLDPEEIDKERGVIHQEWRRSMVGQMRIIETLLPKIYAGNRYGERLPIGTMEVVDNFPPHALRDYYETWYRPDQQGIIVVGDIDPDYIEAKIKEIFSPIKMPAEVKERVYFPVDDTPGTIYAIGKDKEQPLGIVQMMFKSDVALSPEMTPTVAYYPVKFMTDMVSHMFDARLDEITAKPDAPFASAGGYYDDFFLAKTKDAFNVSAVAKGNDILPALEAAYRELRRATEGGFTVGEYERAKSEYLSRAEARYNNRNTRQNEEFVKKYVRNFIDGDPIPSAENEYEIIKSFVNQIPLEAINSFLPEIIKKDNRVVMALIPDKGEFVYPTEEQLAEVIAKVDAETIEPYRDEMKTEPLIPNLPKPGKIVSETHNAQWDATELHLSNGVTVIVKPTKFKDNEVLFSAIAVGGLSELPDEYATDIIYLPYAMTKHGYGTYTATDMQKYLQGTQVALNAGMDTYSREVEGMSTVKDLPKLMELIYAQFTEFSITPDDFTAGTNSFKGILKNQESTPQFTFQNKLYSTIYQSPKRQMITTDVIDKANRENIVNIVKGATANAADFTFVFVGNIDMDTFRPLVEQYIATLPANAATAKKATTTDATMEVAAGNKVDSFTTPMETPQTWVFIAASGTEPYTAKDRYASSIAGQILTKRLIKTVREDMGAVYSISAQGGLDRQDKTNAIIQSAFPMKPEMKQEVLDFIKNEMTALSSNITEEELSAVKEFMVKDAVEKTELNHPWLSAMTATTLNGVDTFNGAPEIINSITVADVQNFVKGLLDQNNYRVIVVDPAPSE